MHTATLGRRGRRWELPGSWAAGFWGGRMWGGGAEGGEGGQERSHSGTCVGVHAWHASHAHVEAVPSDGAMVHTRECRRSVGPARRFGGAPTTIRQRWVETLLARGVLVARVHQGCTQAAGGAVAQVLCGFGRHGARRRRVGLALAVVLVLVRTREANGAARVVVVRAVPWLAIWVDAAALAVTAVGASRQWLAAAVVLAVRLALKPGNAARWPLPPLAPALAIRAGACGVGRIELALAVVLGLVLACKAIWAARRVVKLLCPRPWWIVVVVTSALGVLAVQADILWLALAVVAVDELARIGLRAARVALPRRAAALPPLLVGTRRRRHERKQRQHFLLGHVTATQNLYSHPLNGVMVCDPTVITACRV